MQPTNEKVNRFPVLKDRLNALLMDLDLSTTDFAKKVGITRQTMGYYLNGDRIPDSLTLVKICERCNVSANWLLGLSDTKSLDANVEAVMQYTGLTESNVEFLHNPPRVGEESPLNIYRKSLFTLVNDLVELSQTFNIHIPFFQMQKLLQSFEGKPAHNGGFNQLIAEGSAQKWGYAVLTVNDSIAFYSSQLSKAIEQAIINKYSVVQTEEPRGKRKNLEVNGKKIDVWAE